MTEERKGGLRAKGAIVAWTCLTPDGLGWLFYLKGLGEGRFCLIREGVLDKEEKKMNKVNWVARQPISKSVKTATPNHSRRLCEATYLKV